MSSPAQGGPSNMPRWRGQIITMPRSVRIVGVLGFSAMLQHGAVHGVVVVGVDGVSVMKMLVNITN